MKKAMVYIIVLTMALTALLAGCGEMRGTDGNTVNPTATPKVTAVPETMMPNPADGVVQDRDGIITERDTGTGADGARADGGSAPGAGISGMR